MKAGCGALKGSSGIVIFIGMGPDGKGVRLGARPLGSDYQLFAGLRVKGLGGFRGFRVQGFRVQGLGLGVTGLGSKKP